MKSIERLFVGLLVVDASICFAACSPQHEISAAENQEANTFVSQQRVRASQAESLADQLAAKGDSAAALKSYATALSLIMIYGSYDMKIMFCGQHVAQGWKVNGMTPGHAPAKAGMRDGDVLTAFNGTPIADWSRVRMHFTIDDDPFNPPVLAVSRDGSAPFTIQLGPPEFDLNDGLLASHWSDANRLLEKQVALYAKAGIRPPVPQSAREVAAKAQKLAKAATTSQAIKDASEQFQLASFVAPWWSDLYVNLGLFQDASGDAIGARQSFENYALLNPQGHDLDAVKAKIAGLGSKAGEQQKLIDWEGWWSQLINGQRQTTGMRVTRDGRLLAVTNLEKNKPWLRATVSDDNTAQAIIRFAADSSVLQPAFQRAVDKCFNGAMEMSTTMTLSPDHRQLTLESYNDLDIDASNCAIVQQRKTTMTWVK
jgi:hypothetical protein